MNSLRTYAILEDAWEGGVADWCRGATAHVLGGGRAWMVTTGDGQTNWIKRRLLASGVTLFGVQFLDASRLRRELAARQGLPASSGGRHALELLLRLHALGKAEENAELAAVARHPAACLAALRDYDAAGWTADGPDRFHEYFPPGLYDWLPRLAQTGAWTPTLDRAFADGAEPDPDSPLHLCIFGWDATRFGSLDLLAASVRSATDAEVYIPSPRGTSEVVQQLWVTALEETLGTNFEICPGSGFESAQAPLAARLEGVDLLGNPTAEPALLVGHEPADAAPLVRDFVARWLNQSPVGNDRLAILCSGRSVASVAIVRALSDAGIAVEDEVGELPEPALTLQIQRAILAFYEEDGDLRALLALVELLNAGAIDATKLEPIPVRRALHEGFADLQHHDVRVLVESAALQRVEVAGPLRELVARLGRWPETLPWVASIERWESTLFAFGLTTTELEPLWSQLRTLPIEGSVLATAFFQFLGAVLGGVPPQRVGGSANRFARVVLTTLAGASGQSWGGAVFLDSNEGAWPIYPGENTFLNDPARIRLNARRASHSKPARGYLLTAADRAQLEQFRFLEVLENCRGPLAFAGVARDPADAGRELPGNEWALRCLADSGRVEGSLLDRWRQAVRRVRSVTPALAAGEAAHLFAVHASRRDPDAPFDAYGFNFSALAPADDARVDAWDARDLETAWSRPATFALNRLLGAQPWRDASETRRREAWVVGRLAHAWLRNALNGSPTPRAVDAAEWRAALDRGLPAARAATERALRTGLSIRSDGAAGLPPWWQGALNRTEWVARRCLRTLAATAEANGGSRRWLSMGRTVELDLPTARGPLHLRTHCDVMLLNRASLDGASGILIDLRTGSSPKPGSPTAAQLENGRELGLGAAFLVAVAGGLDAQKSTAGFIHPDVTDLGRWNVESATVLNPILEELAARQHGLAFGQSGRRASGPSRESAEDLPLATTPIPSTILDAKAVRTAAARGTPLGS